MFGRFSAAARRKDSITSAIYGATMAQSRNPVLYAELGVPDTMDGRFDALLLHVILVMERLEREGEPGLALRQSLFDHFFRDMDRTLREMGVGDLTVPKKVRAMAEMFYGRLSAYRPALKAEDAKGLGEAIARNLFPDGEAASAGALAAYVLQSQRLLARASFAGIQSGGVAFADPVRFAPAAASA